MIVEELPADVILVRKMAAKAADLADRPLDLLRMLVAGKKSLMKAREELANKTRGELIEQLLLQEFDPHP